VVPAGDKDVREIDMLLFAVEDCKFFWNMLTESLFLHSFYEK